MLTSILKKVRALTKDFSKSDSESFVYENSKIFTLIENNIVSIIKVEKNGKTFGSGNWDFDSSTNQLEITGSLVSKDIIEVFYTYYKRSDTELKEFVRGALPYISIYSIESETDYELENNDEIQPTPPNKTEDLIAIISAILINPEYSEYRLPTVTVRYPRTMDREERISKLINRFRYGIGVSDVLKWD